MKYDIKKKTKSIVTVQRAWKLNLMKEPKQTRQPIITIVKRFQETGYQLSKDFYRMITKKLWILPVGTLDSP
jgi:hypothetical protein